MPSTDLNDINIFRILKENKTWLIAISIFLVITIITALVSKNITAAFTFKYLLLILVVMTPALLIFDQVKLKNNKISAKIINFILGYALLINLPGTVVALLLALGKVMYYFRYS